LNNFGKTAAFAILAIALVVGVAAMWSETLRINVTVQTGELDVEYVPGSLILLDSCELVNGIDYNASFFPSKGGEQIDDGKDVACTETSFIDTDNDGDYDTMNVTIHNAYPWYYTHIAWAVHNDGTIPWKIWRVIIITPQGNYTSYGLNINYTSSPSVMGESGTTESEGLYLDLNGDNKSDIVLWWGDNFGVQLHPCWSADISMDITVLQEAPENANLTFMIQFEVIQWNEYYVPLTPV